MSSNIAKLHNKWIKFLSNFILNKEKRHEFRDSCYKDESIKFKLIMTLVCKNEIDIIENHILFHKAMGVDGLIVTDNNSTDGTREILQKYKDLGYILEIIDEPSKTHMHSVWVDRMIKLAKNKYKADWVINSDADEFWYAHSLNLKTDILKNTGCNAMNVIICNYIPIEDSENYIKGTYFLKRSLCQFEMEKFNIENIHFNRSEEMPKVLHNTKDYVMIGDGNHDVAMKNKKTANISNITIYHYFIRNYNHFEDKIVKGYESLKNHPDKNIGWHWRYWYEEYYTKGKLRQAYDEMYSLDRFNELIDLGCFVKDPSVINFLECKVKQD